MEGGAHEEDCGYPGVINDAKVRGGPPVVRKWPRGRDVSWGPWKERGNVMDTLVTLSRNPNQPDGGSDCYSRIRWEHHQAVT